MGVEKHKIWIKKYLIIATFFGCTAVIFGAFSSHFLKNVISAGNLNTFKIGVTYQFYHCFAILITILLQQQFKNLSLKSAARFFCLGVFLFSGSLYLLGFKDLLNLSIVKILGPLTPIGGFFLILGWITLLLQAIKLK